MPRHFSYSALRPIALEEAAAMVADDRAARRWAEDFPRDDDRSIAALVLGGTIKPTDTGAPWGSYLIVDPSDGLAVGTAGFKSAPSAGAVELGYGVCASRRRRGLATRAVRALSALARDSGATVLYATTRHGNVASEGVLASCGFVLDVRTDHELTWRRDL